MIKNLIDRKLSMLESYEIENIEQLRAIALAGYFGQFIPVYIIYAVGGAFIALAGFFGWIALPKESYTTPALEMQGPNN
jgi:hypothetical protein